MAQQRPTKEFPTAMNNDEDNKDDDMNETMDEGSGRAHPLWDEADDRRCMMTVRLDRRLHARVMVRLDGRLKIVRVGECTNRHSSVFSMR